MDSNTLISFFSLLMLRQNFDVILYDQATGSPTMSYTVHGKKNKLSIKTNFVIYKLNSPEHLRTVTRSLATNSALKTVIDHFYFAVK